MSDRVGGLLVWALFLLGTWYYARPVLIFIAAAGIVSVALLGVVRKLERQGEALSESWTKEREGK